MSLTKKFVLSFGLLLAFFFGCSENPSQAIENGAISINLIADAASDFSAIAQTAEVKVSADGMPTLTQQLTVIATGISGTVTGIVAGPGRKFEVFVYDAASKLCYYGSSVGEVTAGGTANILLTLYRTNGEGNATISGTIQSSNTPPVVSLTSPASNAQYTVGSAISLAATASDANGSISSVSFYNGTTLLTTDNTAPYSYSFTASAAGSYTFSAVATDNAGTSTTSANVTVTVTAIPPQTSYKINCGGSAVSPFTADQYSSGGTQHSVTNTITTGGVTNPAPAAVYQSERYGAMTYTLPNLTAGAQYTVRLHFAELYQTATGKRKFNVGINGTSVLSNFDIYATAGGQYKAIVREFTASPNASKQIVINLTTVTDNATINGIEILPLATTYSITYNLNGGTNSPTNPSSYSASYGTFPLYNASRTGYTFDGWYDNAAFTGTAVTAITSGTTDNKTFWAKWIENSYTITYNLNGGTNSPTNPSSYSASYGTFPLYNASRTGNTFDGWYDNAAFTGTAVTAITSGTTGNKTFWAKWIAVSYTITYNLNGGTNSPNNPATYVTSGNAIILYNPSKTCSSFDGWYSDASFTTRVYGTSAGSTGNLSVWVKWISDGPVISTQPVTSIPVHLGDDGTVSCVGPAGATYQWYLASSGAAISGATSSSFVTVPTATTSYYCIVRSPATGCTTQSTTVTFVVFQ